MKLLRDGWNAYGLFRAHRYYLELNWYVAAGEVVVVVVVVVLFVSCCF